MGGWLFMVHPFGKNHLKIKKSIIACIVLCNMLLMIDDDDNDDDDD
jgi:hypothetical protein